eukprot:343138-Prymnesium_polylepis.1
MHTPCDENHNASIMTCCGQPICNACILKISTGPRHLRDLCPLCRGDMSQTRSDAAIVSQLQASAARGNAT